MIKFALRFALLCAWCAPVAPAHATTVHVPVDYATIPLAIASAPDTIYVANGTYPDSIAIDASLVLLPEPGMSLYALPAYPTIGSVTFTSRNPRVLVIRGFHLAGYFVQVNTFNCGGSTTLEGCRIDAGVILTLTGCSITNFNMRGCIVRGGAFTYCYYQAIDGCTFLDGGLEIRSHGNASLRSNLFLGPAPFGITTHGDALVDVEDNVIEGVVEGIVGDSYATYRRNVVRNVTGSAYRLGGSPKLYDNVAQGATLHGFDLSGPSSSQVFMSGNAIESVGGDGIHALCSGNFIGNAVRDAGGHGIRVTGLGSLTRNRVLRVGGDGLLVGRGVIRENVIGRAQGRGIATLASSTVSSNTSYFNTGAGYDLVGIAADTLRNNVAYGNTGSGLVWSGTAVTPACNDWFANTPGATFGVSPGPTDLQVDPQFCNLPQDSVTLSSGSPLLNAPGCGLIGALGLGCAAALNVDPSIAPGDLHLSIAPLPTRGRLKFTWAPRVGTVELAVYDVAGAQRWAIVTDGSPGRFEWTGRDGMGVPLGAGVYFARVKSAGQQSTAKVMIVP